MPKAPLSVGAYGEQVARLHELLRQQGFELPAAEVGRSFFGPATRLAVRKVQQQQGLPVTGQIDAATARAIGVVAQSSLPTVAPAPPSINGGGGDGGGAKGNGAGGGGGAVGGGPTAQYSLQGALVFDYGLPAAGIAVRLYHIVFAGPPQQLGQTTSDVNGHYVFTYEVGAGQATNLQLRALDSQGQEVTLSATKFAAHAQEVLNLVVPAQIQPLKPEYDRLASDVKAQIGGIAQLAQAQENASRQDITLLSAATRWDARLLALAATAAQLGAASAQLGADQFYALLRMGLPSDPQHLAMVPTDTVRLALTKAAQAGIVSLTDQQVAAGVAAFETFATQTRLTVKAPGATATYGELLGTILPDTTQQGNFATLFLNYSPANGTFWQQAAQLAIPAQTLDALKFQGKLLYLTFNNAQLVQKLQLDLGSLENLSQLADRDYYDSTMWKSTLIALAGSADGPALRALIPPGYKGTAAPDRLEAYAADLARKVRFSFPTHVVARLIERGDLPMDQAAATTVTAFLRAAAPLGYELGRTPLNTLLKSFDAVRSAAQSGTGVAQSAAANVPALDAASLRSLKTLHRLYQITPSNESLQAALQLKFTSARDIAAHTQDDFMNKYASAFPSPAEAALVYAKAQQVSAVTFNVLTMARMLDASPGVYGLSGAADERQHARDALLQRFPAMQGLFGSGDSDPA